tara:strand:+ start:2444 stop:2572 length:129 start_codon:yes stop_codon:yes gene_type:complete
MNEKEIDTQVKALLDLTDNSYAAAMFLVCLDIQVKESNNYCG